MTIFKPNSKSFAWLSPAIMIAGGLVVGAVVWLVFLYTGAVHLKYSVNELHNRAEKTELEIAELKDALFKMFDSDRLEALARERDLVKEKEPFYFSVSEAWELASH